MEELELTAEELLTSEELELTAEELLTSEELELTAEELLTSEELELTAEELELTAEELELLRSCLQHWNYQTLVLPVQHFPLSFTCSRTSTFSGTVLRGCNDRGTGACVTRAYS